VSAVLGGSRVARKKQQQLAAEATASAKMQEVLVSHALTVREGRLQQKVREFTHDKS
jgi:hypothetical protein